jgi:hypothetical protein
MRRRRILIALKRSTHEPRPHAFVTAARSAGEYCDTVRIECTRYTDVQLGRAT